MKTHPQALLLCVLFFITFGLLHLVEAGGQEELRPLINDTYNTQSGSLKYLFRNYFSSSRRLIRYPDDVNDRHWYPFFDEDVWTELTTNLNVNSSNGYDPPKSIMASAATPISNNAPFNFTWSLIPSTAEFYSYMHFADIQTLRANDTREFNFILNGNVALERYRPKTFAAGTIFLTKPKTCEGGKCIIELLKTSKSTLPPDLSSSHLTGIIAPAFQNLTHLQKLDLSNNNLTGGVPEFLASIKSLLVILEGNIYLNCPGGSCVHKDGNGGAKKKNVLVLVVVSIAVVVVLGTALALFLVFRKRKTPHSEGIYEKLIYLYKHFNIFTI
ncbi:hypothetical protein ARALYDRAFT_899236 [Arabidopsis lyrata subsp. lyrata]|uniref:Malectin-like domain-containing protein n=1 Tax=Arabidopsis lyrata subsp. lyrata TaxID=81972 RepID=D7L7H4_ARALL|nr:hypothetical protein ARALYDRAFT_899236 [Arabidopsis lyrata subsp. lyrata]